MSRQSPAACYGVGSESSYVAQSAIVARWFRDKELAMAFGITLTIARLGTLFSFNTEQLPASRFGRRGALWIAAVCGLIFSILLLRADPCEGGHLERAK